MKIIDWKPIGNHERGKFALEFEVTPFCEDEIRHIINDHIKVIKKTLEVSD